MRLSLTNSLWIHHSILSSVSKIFLMPHYVTLSMQLTALFLILNESVLPKVFHRKWCVYSTNSSARLLVATLTQLVFIFIFAFKFVQTFRFHFIFNLNVLAKITAYFIRTKSSRLTFTFQLFRFEFRVLICHDVNWFISEFNVTMHWCSL